MQITLNASRPEPKPEPRPEPRLILELEEDEPIKRLAFESRFSFN